jgi:hypothetical protein
MMFELHLAGVEFITNMYCYNTKGFKLRDEIHRNYQIRYPCIIENMSCIVLGYCVLANNNESKLFVSVVGRQECTV